MKHLGNILENDNSFKIDSDIKRGRFIGKLHSLQQEFHFCSPEVKMKLYNIYTFSFYGSNLYDLFGDQSNRLYAAFNQAVRMAYNVSRCTHKYLIETLSDCVHPKVLLCSRLVKFVDSMLNCRKSNILFLITLCKDDKRTIIGRNLSKIAKECDTEVHNLNCKIVKENMTAYPVPKEEQWRIQILKEMILCRQFDTLSIDNFDTTEIGELLQIVCES